MRGPRGALSATSQCVSLLGRLQHRCELPLLPAQRLRGEGLLKLQHSAAPTDTDTDTGMTQQHGNDMPRTRE